MAIGGGNGRRIRCTAEIETPWTNLIYRLVVEAGLAEGIRGHLRGELIHSLIVEAALTDGICGHLRLGAVLILGVLAEVVRRHFTLVLVCDGGHLVLRLVCVTGEVGRHFRLGLDLAIGQLEQGSHLEEVGGGGMARTGHKVAFVIVGSEIVVTRTWNLTSIAQVTHTTVIVFVFIFVTYCGPVNL